MAWYMSIISYLWNLFTLWISTIFVAPFRHLDMLWLLVPIWLTWFFAEFFQEKLGTSMGNAITNAVVVVWGGIDCTRQTVRLISEGALAGFWNLFARFSLAVVLFIYGIMIIFFGLRGNKIIKYIGRVRGVTYVFAMFVPVFYNVMELTFDHILAAFLFFPVFYFAIEFIDKYAPNPKAVDQDVEDRGGGSSSLSSLDSFDKKPLHSPSLSSMSTLSKPMSRPNHPLPPSMPRRPSFPNRRL
jgi:hypothetical protein